MLNPSPTPRNPKPIELMITSRKVTYSCSLKKNMNPRNDKKVTTAYQINRLGCWLWTPFSAK